MPDLGWQELLIILVIVIFIFGAGKLPELSGSIGKTIKEFKANSEIGGDADKDKVEAGTVSSATRTAPDPVTVPRQERADEI
jgi:sec-independent protein translocase protein TatA